MCVCMRVCVHACVVCLCACKFVWCVCMCLCVVCLSMRVCVVYVCLCVCVSTHVVGQHDGEQGLVVWVEGDVEGGGLHHDEDGVEDWGGDAQEDLKEPMKPPQENTLKDRPPSNGPQTQEDLLTPTFKSWGPAAHREDE